MFRCFDKLYFVWIYCIKSSDLNLPLIQWKKYIYTAHMVCYSLQAWWNHQFPLPPGCLHLQCPVNTIQLSSRTAHTHKGNNLHQTETVWHGLFSLWNQHKEIVNVQLLQLTCMMMNHKRPLFVFLKLSDSPSKKKNFLKSTRIRRNSIKHIMRAHCTCGILITVLIFLRYPAPPAASAAYGQPLQSPYNSMASAAPPPAQQLTNQMSAMNLGNYGKFAISYLLQIIQQGVPYITPNKIEQPSNRFCWL